MDGLRKKRVATSNQADSAQRKSIQTGKLMQRSPKGVKFEMMEQLDNVKEMIDRHTRSIQSSVSANAKETVDFVQALQHKRSAQVETPQTEQKHKNANAKLSEALSSLFELWNNLRQTKSGPEVEFELAEPKGSNRPAKQSTATNLKASTKAPHGEKPNDESDEEPKVLASSPPNQNPRVITDFSSFQFIIGVEPKLDFTRRQYSVSGKQTKQVSSQWTLTIRHVIKRLR